MSTGALRWRCRRGMKELDVLLGRWIEQRHASATSEQRAAFEHFLDLPDPDMARYLLGRVPPPAEYRAIRDELLALARVDASDRPAEPSGHRA